MDQNWLANGLGLLTSRLLATHDGAHVWAVLREHLPAVNVRQALAGFFEAEADDPVAGCELRDIFSAPPEPLWCASRSFPPPGLLPAEAAFSLALLPLVTQSGRRGFIAFDTNSLDSLGSIAQQVVGALNSVQLYQEAVEGRRLAEEANRTKTRFLSTVSHELRTPLSLIVGLSDILLQASRTNPRALAESYLGDIQRIHTSAQQIGGLIRDVLDLANSDSGKLRLTREVLDLSQALRPVADTGRQMAHDKSLTWLEALPEPGPQVWGDPARLRQIILNLVSNAVKYTPRGSVSLRIEAAAGLIRVVVSDTGIGVPPGEQSSIFDEFQRSSRTQAQGYGGLGLGLAISQRLAELHGGQIALGASGPDAGSVFYFTLPVAEVAAPARLESRPAAEPMVLVLTHHAGQGEALRAHLSRQGRAVQLVQLDDEPDWVGQVTAALPMAVVMDVGVPPQLGWPALRLLREHPALRTLPVLFYSLSPAGGVVVEAQGPTSSELARRLELALAPAGPGQREKVILVVDDDPHTRDMHVRMVRSQAGNFRVLTAPDGRTALNELQQERPDLVLLDLMMPDMDGFHVLEAMRANAATRHIPVIVLTGQSLTEKEMAQLNQGVTTVLEKGLFNVAETLAHVEAALSRKRKLSTEAQRLVRQAMAYLHEHYAETITREALARHVGLSNDYLTASFRKELGLTPIAYLNRYRVYQAKALLADPSKSVLQVALAVGFSDSGYFSRVFRHEVGLAPEAFRHS